MSQEMISFQTTYNSWILRIGDGSQPRDNADAVEIPAWMRFQDDTSDPLIDFIYGDLNSHHEDRDAYWSRRAILHARNDAVDSTNAKVLSTVAGDTSVHLSADVALTPDGDEHPAFPSEHLANFNPPGVPPHRLCLKVGAPVMLLRNLDPSNGLCNGTRLIVTAIRNRVLQVKILTGASKHRGKVVLIPRINNRTGEGTLPFVLDRRQFPVRLCFAMTINKSQGQSIHRVGIDLRTPCFSHGQLYVALSRATDGANVRVLLPPTHSATPNIVLTPAMPSPPASVPASSAPS